MNFYLNSNVLSSFFRFIDSFFLGGGNFSKRQIIKKSVAVFFLPAEFSSSWGNRFSVHYSVVFCFISGI